MADAAAEYRYNRLTWAEMDEAIELEKLVILPTGSTEQHGRHLPLDVDLFLIAERADQHTRPVQKGIRF